MAEFKKGELLCKFGENADKVIYLQSGRVRILVPKKNHMQEIAQISAPAILCEYAFLGLAKNQYTVEATTPGKTLEIAAAKAVQTLETAPDFLKVTSKSLLETLKQVTSQLKTELLKNDPSPLPDLKVPQTFYILYALALNHGEKNAQGHILLKWKFAKNFAYKVFQLKIEQFEGALFLLKKLGMIDLIYKLEKEDENNEKEKATQVLHDIIIPDAEFIFSFADFYQIYFYKPGSEGMLRVEQKPLQVLDIMLACVEEIEVDRRGAVKTTMKTLIEYCQKNSLPPVKSDHFDVLASKGLFCKVAPQDTGEVFVSFDKKEFSNMRIYWHILKEIELWNQRGKVLMVEEKAKSVVGNICSNGHNVADINAKFCGECGAKMGSKAA